MNDDNTYAIAYDDGDREENVQPALVRAAVPDAPDAPEHLGRRRRDGVPAFGTGTEPAEPEPATEEDATDGVFNLTAINERKELPAPRRLDMNANDGEGEKPLRKERLKPKPRPGRSRRAPSARPSRPPKK